MSRMHHRRKIASDAIAVFTIGFAIFCLVIGPLLGGLAHAINAFGNFAQRAAVWITG